MELTNEQLTTLGFKINNVYKTVTEYGIKHLNFTIQDLIRLGNEGEVVEVQYETKMDTDESDVEEGVEETNEDVKEEDLKHKTVAQIKEMLKQKGYTNDRLFGHKEHLLDLLTTGTDVFDDIPDPTRKNVSGDDVIEFFNTHSELVTCPMLKKICKWRGLTFNATGDEDELLLTLKNGTKLPFLERIQSIPNIKKPIEEMKSIELYQLCLEKKIPVKKNYSKQQFLDALK